MTQSKNKIGDFIECSCCGKTYKKHRKHGRRCRDCENRLQREKRRREKDATTKRYEKTKKGFLMRTYRNMLSRVKGIQKKNFLGYYGLEILPKEEFYEWSLNNEDFHTIFEEWEKRGYEQKYSPSIDRIDPREGYYLLNMQWITVSENTKRAMAFHWHGKII